MEMIGSYSSLSPTLGARVGVRLSTIGARSRLDAIQRVDGGTIRERMIMATKVGG